jgi:hypothetical protein
MSFFRRGSRKTKEEEEKEEYIKREREYNEKKRDKFLSDYDKKKASDELKDSSLVDNNPSTASHDGPSIDESKVFTGSARKKSLRERIGDYKVKRAGDKAEKELKKFKQGKDKEERLDAERKVREKKIFGHELSEEERSDLKKAKEEARLQKQIKNAQRSKQIQENYGKFENTLGKINKQRKRLSGIGVDFSKGLGISATEGQASAPMGNLDMVNAFSATNQQKAKSNKLANDMISFDLNFGNMLGGKKANKKPGKHPLDVL